MRRKIAILISGRGSNMLSLLELRQQDDFPGDIVLVLSNRHDATGLAGASQAGVPTAVIDHKQFPDRKSFDRAMSDVLEKNGVNLVVLAGFMRILSTWFVERWQGRLINIHPSLLPLFRGVDTHRRALEEGVRIHGCTVHYVVPGLDAGPIIAQAAVPILPDDDEQSLSARVLAQEHLLYPQALRMICSDLVMLQNGRTAYKTSPCQEDASKALRFPTMQP